MINKFLKIIKDNIKSYSYTILIIILFYTVKFTFNIYTSFPIKYDSFFKLIIISLSSILNIFLAYIFFIKLIIKARSIRKAKTATQYFLVSILISIFLNDIFLFLGSNLLNINIYIMNLITFILIYKINKLIKIKIIKTYSYKKTTRLQ